MPLRNTLRKNNKYIRQQPDMKINLETEISTEMIYLKAHCNITFGPPQTNNPTSDYSAMGRIE